MQPVNLLNILSCVAKKAKNKTILQIVISYTQNSLHHASKTMYTKNSLIDLLNMILKTNYRSCA